MPALADTAAADDHAFEHQSCVVWSPQVPERWTSELAERAEEWGPAEPEVDYAALMARIDSLSPDAFAELDLDTLLGECSKVGHACPHAHVGRCVVAR